MSSPVKGNAVIFFGTESWGVPALRELIQRGIVTAVVTQPEKKRGRGLREKSVSPVAQCAVEHNVRILRPARLDSAFCNALSELLPATFLVIAYGKIISRNVLDYSSLQPINVHPSLLPELRGPSPQRTALMFGVSRTGVTLIQMDEKPDHGPILAQQVVEIADDETFETLDAKLASVTASFVSYFVPKYLKGQLKPVPQQHDKATYTKMFRSEDGALDFSMRAAEICQRVRALNPWPGTYFIADSKRFKVLKAVASDRPSGSARFFRTTGNRLGIRCGSGDDAGGAIEVILIQPEGKRAMDSGDFLNGYPAILRAE